MTALDRTYHPSHEMVTDEYGVDTFRLAEGYHNGPECKRCGTWCHHCDPERSAAPCPVGGHP